MTLAVAQREAGHRVEFATFKGKRFGSQVEAAGFRVHEVAVRAKIDPVAIAVMRGVMLRGGFDIVHTHLSTSSVNGCLAARSARVPSVATVHGMSGKLSFVGADHLIAVSQQVKDHLVEQGVREEKITVVYNGLEMEEPSLDRDAARTRLGLSPDAIVLGTIARVTPAKGIDDALRAVAIMAPKIPRLRYLVVGDGDGLPACRKLAQDLQISDRVTFLGYRTDIANCLDTMDMFLFPSHKEAMGIALVEAMWAGLPTVATRIGGIPEVITPQCGILVPSHNPEAVAKATMELLDDDALRDRMGAAAGHRARTVFSSQSMREATDWVYRSMLGQGLPIPQPSPKSRRSGHRRR
ncbi:glycosyl transferase family protein [Fimbriimonas ginsengisoli Gsoil 348]|uniref:Glycosyl transferase family protein n=2 Tax=Fimbriimonas ginsengisoli TaxID=1005039 RepID=A0A068NUK2_FIMGI|nr:glycosyl transferase family protein [Fimbriimonas ginsengisoli Gsoil 348]